jgi:hypothetical protein
MTSLSGEVTPPTQSQRYASTIIFGTSAFSSAATVYVSYVIRAKVTMSSPTKPFFREIMHIVPGNVLSQLCYSLLCVHNTMNCKFGNKKSCISGFLNSAHTSIHVYYPTKEVIEHVQVKLDRNVVHICHYIFPEYWFVM